MSLQQPHAGNHADVTDLALELAAARPPVHSASLVLPALSPGSVPRASPLHHRPDAPAAPPRHTARTGAGPSPRFIPDSVILHNCGHTGPKNGNGIYPSLSRPRPAQLCTLTLPGPGPDGSHGSAPDMDQRARDYGPGPGPGPHGPVRDPDQWACTLGPRASHTTARTSTRSLIPPRPAQPGTLTHPGPGPDGSHGPAPDMDQRAREYGPGPGSGPHGPVRDPDQWACTLGPRAPHTTARTPTRTLIQLGPEAAGPKPTARPLHAQMGRERSRSSSRRRSVVCTLAHGNAPVHGPAPGSRSAPPMTSHLTGQAHPRHAGHKGGHHWR
jgi:hypothetical protein